MKINIKFDREKMCKDFFLHEIYLLIKENKRKWQSAAAFAALAGGFFSLGIAIVLNLIIWLIPFNHLGTLFYETCVTFYAVTLPLLLLGSHCLDLLEKNNLPAALFQSKAIPDDKYRVKTTGIVHSFEVK